MHDFTVGMMTAAVVFFSPSMSHPFPSHSIPVDGGGHQTAFIGQLNKG